jgi:putative ABC transport system substrate-binding protein
MYKYLSILFLFFYLIGCTEENVTNVNGFERNLVIISDDEPSSDMIIKIKGNVNKEHPDVNIHYYPAKPFDVSEASYLLKLAAESYPDDTYFAVIVDPGLDDDKLIIKSGNRTVLAPNNGTTTRFRESFTTDESIIITNLAMFDNQYEKITDIPPDIFYSKSINYMLSNIPVSDFGEDAGDNLVNLDITKPSYNSGVAVGEILYVYNFGNCETNIPKSIMSNFEYGDILEIQTPENKFFAVYGNNYSAANMNENVAVISGDDDLRLAVNFGNLSERYNLHSGTKLSIKKAYIKVGILQYNNSELVQSIIAGTIGSIKKHGFETYENIEYIIRNANGNISNLKNLVNELVAEDVDIIIPVSTPASQAAIEFAPENIPVIFTYVTSPEFAGILNKRKYVTGLSDATNVSDYLNFVKELMPEIKKAGRIYNPDEANSEFFQTEFEKNSSYFNLDYITEEISEGSDINSIFGSITEFSPDAVLIGADNTINLNMDILSELCIENDIPLIGDSAPNTIDGALASIAVDYDALAESTGDYTASIILGISADDLPVKRFGNSVITLNQNTASAIGFDFPQSIISKASDIIQ